MATSEDWVTGDVVVVPFPYADVLAEKRRPAAVVAAIREHGLLWVVMITSAENRGWTTDVPIEDAARAGLPKASVVRPAKIACIAADRVIRRAGTLTEAAAALVCSHISGFLEPRSG